MVKNRIGLYMMVGIGCLATVEALDKIENLSKRYEDDRHAYMEAAGKASYNTRMLEQLLKNSTNLELKTENVIGNSEPETFYVLNGEKAYRTIDGKPVESYFPQKKIEVEASR